MEKEAELSKEMIIEVKSFMRGILKLHESDLRHDFDIKVFIHKFLPSFINILVSHYGQSKDAISFLNGLSRNEIKITPSGFDKQISVIVYIVGSLLSIFLREVFETGWVEPKNIKLLLDEVLTDLNVNLNKIFSDLVSSTTGEKNEEEQTSKD